MMHKRVKKRLLIVLAMLLTAGMLFSGKISAYAEENVGEVTELSFGAEMVKEPAIGEAIPDSVLDSYYTNLLSAPTPVPTHTFIVRKDADGSELGGYDTLYDTLRAIELDNQESGKAYTITVTRDYGEDDKTGIIPRYADVTITSSPGPIPRIRRVISAQAVLEFRQTAFDVPLRCATSRSNSFVLGPVVIHPDFSASTTSLISASVISGGLKGILL